MIQFLEVAVTKLIHRFRCTCSFICDGAPTPVSAQPQTMCLCIAINSQLMNLLQSIKFRKSDHRRVKLIPLYVQYNNTPQTHVHTHTLVVLSRDMNTRRPKAVSAFRLYRHFPNTDVCIGVFEQGQGGRCLQQAFHSKINEQQEAVLI